MDSIIIQILKLSDRECILTMNNLVKGSSGKNAKRLDR